ncbi:type II toxin-antitoxin system RelE/ParE family toxin [Nocardioides sp. BYT-33-1]|uniref:type II toxin-antitoxin system RelE/ParE family toxin n=1 Tax=Nocardioides sp. BYT-33-1 TaxID=3416952 RepID=UPI003F529B11
MPVDFRLSEAALNDIDHVLAMSYRQFGEQARLRYEALIAAALRHAAQSRDSALLKRRPELGADVLSWHLRNSVVRTSNERVKRPRHVLYCRWEGERLAVGRFLHEVMDPRLHLDPAADWA